jgi:hypothetical protein
MLIPFCVAMCNTNYETGCSTCLTPLLASIILCLLEKLSIYLSVDFLNTKKIRFDSSAKLKTCITREIPNENLTQLRSTVNKHTYDATVHNEMLDVKEQNRWN